MQRWTARFLLLLALVGTILPMALEATAAPSHLCCRRTGQHHCHNYALTNPNQPVVASPGCGHDCCRGVTTSQTAHPKPPIAVIAHQFAAVRACESTPAAPHADFFSFASTRAPPGTLIA